MDEPDRYALDIEKIATGAGTLEERGSAVDIKCDECLLDLKVKAGTIRLKGAPATKQAYLAALAARLTRLRPVVGDEALPLIDRAIARVRQAEVG